MIREGSCSLSGTLFRLFFFSRPSPLSGCAGKKKNFGFRVPMCAEKGRCGGSRFAEPTAPLTFVLWIGMQRRKARGKMNE